MDPPSLPPYAAGSLSKIRTRAGIFNVPLPREKIGSGIAELNRRNIGQIPTQARGKRSILRHCSEDMRQVGLRSRKLSTMLLKAAEDFRYAHSKLALKSNKGGIRYSFCQRRK